MILVFARSRRHSPAIQRSIAFDITYVESRYLQRSIPARHDFRSTYFCHAWNL